MFVILSVCVCLAPPSSCDPCYLLFKYPTFQLSFSNNQTPSSRVHKEWIQLVQQLKRTRWSAPRGPQNKTPDPALMWTKLPSDTCSQQRSPQMSKSFNQFDSAVGWKLLNSSHVQQQHFNALITAYSHGNTGIY